MPNYLIDTKTLSVKDNWEGWLGGVGGGGGGGRERERERGEGEFRK